MQQIVTDVTSSEINTINAKIEPLMNVLGGIFNKY